MNISPKQYAELAQYILDETKNKTQVKESVVKLAKLIVGNCDQHNLAEIIEQFEELLKERKGIIKVEVVSAKEFSVERENSLKDVIAEKLKISRDLIEIVKEVDESLIGGISVKIGDQIVDGSLKAKIEKLENSLL